MAAKRMGVVRQPLLSYSLYLAPCDFLFFPRTELELRKLSLQEVPATLAKSLTVTQLIKKKKDRFGEQEYIHILLTPWCRVLLEKLTGLQLVKKFSAYMYIHICNKRLFLCNLHFMKHFI